MIIILKILRRMLSLAQPCSIITYPLKENGFRFIKPLLI